MPRILVLATRYPDVDRPNLGVFVRRQMIELAARGVAIEVVVPFDSEIEPTTAAVEIDHGLRVHRVPYVRDAQPQRQASAIARAVLPIVRDIRANFAFDAVSAEFAWPEGPVAAILGRAFGVPVSIKARGHDFELTLTQRGSDRRMLRAAHAADGLLAVSDDVKATMVAAGLSGDRIEVHYPAVDLDCFRLADRSAAKAALRLSGPVTIIVGNLFWRKQPALAIRALTLLPDVTLVVVGSGPDAAALRSLVTELGLEARVRFYGSVPHPLLPRFYAAADVAIHCPSVEGFANVRIEALACGVPLVTTAVGSAREILTTPEAGRIVAPDPAAIALGVRQLLASNFAPDAVRQAALPFSWNRSAVQLEAYYRALLRRASRRQDRPEPSAPDLDVC